MEEYFPAKALEYCATWYDLSEVWVSGLGDKSRIAYTERENHVKNCQQCQTALAKEGERTGKIVNRGFEFAFKGAMNAYGILAHKTVFWLGHVTGAGGDSAPHYWPDDCETCKEISKFVSDLAAPERQLTPRPPDTAMPSDNATVLHK